MLNSHKCCDRQHYIKQVNTKRSDKKFIDNHLSRWSRCQRITAVEQNSQDQGELKQNQVDGLSVDKDASTLRS